MPWVHSKRREPENNGNSQSAPPSKRGREAKPGRRDEQLVPVDIYVLSNHLHYPGLLQRAEPVLYSTSMRPPPLEVPALRVLTWNVASLRSLLKNVRAPRA